MTKTFEEKKKQQIYDLMTAIRKNSKGSEGIEVFGKLLDEVQDYVLVSTVIKNINKFIEDFMLTCRDIDKMESNALKAKILTYDFLCVEKYFKETNKQMTNVMSKLNFCNYEFDERRFYEFGKTSIIGKFKFKFISEGGLLAPDGFVRGANYTKEQKEMMFEDIRKSVLLWNYIPVVVKALIMTKRRSCGFDTNSKRF